MLSLSFLLSHSGIKGLLLGTQQRLPTHEHTHGYRHIRTVLPSLPPIVKIKQCTLLAQCCWCQRSGRGSGSVPPLS